MPTSPTIGLLFAVVMVCLACDTQQKPEPVSKAPNGPPSASDAPDVSRATATSAASSARGEQPQDGRRQAIEAVRQANKPLADYNRSDLTRLGVALDLWVMGTAVPQASAGARSISMSARSEDKRSISLILTCHEDKEALLGAQRELERGGRPFLAEGMCLLEAHATPVDDGSKGLPERAKQVLREVQKLRRF